MLNVSRFPLARSRESLEIKLAKDSIKGDSKAYTELVKLYKSDLYKIAYSYVKDEQKALDILQETTYKGLLNIKKLKEATFFKTWMTRILINIAIDYSKKESNVVYLEEEHKLIQNEKCVSIEEKLDLYDAIDSLRENYKMVIILKYFNDMTEEQVASVMDIPINTVKSHLRRARLQLKEILKEGEIYE
ncbi:MAG: sigma-70 family RNA polymerase sigma factor [Peptostreptococcaceae bacterium]